MHLHETKSFLNFASLAYTVIFFLKSKKFIEGQERGIGPSFLTVITFVTSPVS